MNSPQVYLGVDLGAESGRVVAGLWDGRRMLLEELHRFSNGPIALAETLRWDVLHLWSEIQSGLTLGARKFGRRIVSLGVDTWGLDYVLMSRSDELLGLPFCYRDARTRGLVDETLRRVTREEIFAGTGLQFMEINTLYQWIAHRRASPELFDSAATFLMIPDWLNWCLCGAKAVELTNASTTQFLDPQSQTWARGLLGRLDLPSQMLPELVAPGTRLGFLRGDVAARTGLGPVPVIAPATHDTGSAVAGTPGGTLGDGHWAYISSGTWSLVGVETRNPILSAGALEANITNEGGVNGTWRVLKNVMGLWLLQRCRAAFEASGTALKYSELLMAAESASPLRSLVDPDDSRFLNPPDMPAALCAYCRETGQPEPADIGACVRCVLESLALKYAVILDRLERLTGHSIRVVHVVGGGSRNEMLNQFTAEASGRSVVAGPVEATVMGNLLVQTQAIGELGSLGDLRRVVRDSSDCREILPNPAAASRWNEARVRFYPGQ